MAKYRNPNKNAVAVYDKDGLVHTFAKNGGEKEIELNEATHKKALETGTLEEVKAKPEAKK